MKKLVAASIITASVLTTGCASVSNSPEQEVRIASNPPGAVLKVDGKFEGMTPMTVHLSRRNDHKFTIEKPGYIANNGELRSHFRFSKWFFGNLLPLPVVGPLIDIATGSANTLKPLEVSVDLGKEEQ